MNSLRIYIGMLLVSISASYAMGQDKRDFSITLSGEKSSPRVLACEAPEFSFHLPQMAGNFRIGLINKEESKWGSELQKVSTRREKGKITYTLTDRLLGKGSVVVRAARLTDSDGIVLEVEPRDIPEGVRLAWSFGGCYGKVLENPAGSRMEPRYCKYNVFSVEWTAFTVYYGESMKLKTIQGVTPVESDIRLSDAHQQQTPLALYESGKKTDAPALSAACPLRNGEKLYFCLYTQNAKADYNYYLLPDLFRREFEGK